MASDAINALADRLPLLSDDRRYIRRLLAGQPPHIVAAALQDYELTWLAASEAEPVEHKQNNTGRRAANDFLRVVVWPTVSVRISNAA